VGVIYWMGNEALVIAPDWTLLAASANTPKNGRLAALRGLAAMGDWVRIHGSNRHATLDGRDLRGLFASADSDISAAAFKTLVAFRDPTVAAMVAESCNPSEISFARFPESDRCLWDLAAIGQDARSAGSQLMKFLASPNGEEVANAISV